MNVYVETLGCAKNRVDSEIMLGTLNGAGFKYVNDYQKADIIIINTCGFLTSAVNESIDRILSLAEMKNKGHCQILIVAGCMVERYRDQIKTEIPEIDGLIGTSDYTEVKDIISDILENCKENRKLNGNPSYSNKNIESSRVLSTQPYAYLKIAEGCSNSCSFCNIPKLRGRQKSKPFERIHQEARYLLDAGIKEINLISQDCSSYGRDLNEKIDLFALIYHLLEGIVDDFWLRVFYSYPNRFPERIFSLMLEDKRLVPYIDVPFQHASNTVLKQMNRNISIEEMERLINNGLEKVKDLSIRTTLMVGFPTETEQDFKKLLKLVEKGYFHHLGVFKYSHEENIKSYSLGDMVDEEVKEERRNILMEAQQKISLQKNKAMVGQIQKVLLEGEYEETDLLLNGRNKYQGPEVDGLVLVNEGVGLTGQFSDVMVTEAYPYDVIGRIV